jgi:hypothetical protein
MDVPGRRGMRAISVVGILGGGVVVWYGGSVGEGSNCRVKVGEQVICRWTVIWKKEYTYEIWS